MGSHWTPPGIGCINSRHSRSCHLQCQQLKKWQSESESAQLLVVVKLQNLCPVLHVLRPLAGPKGWRQLAIPFADCTNCLLFWYHTIPEAGKQKKLTSDHIWRARTQRMEPIHIPACLWKTGLKCPPGWCLHTPVFPSVKLGSDESSFGQI